MTRTPSATLAVLTLTALLSSSSMTALQAQSNKAAAEPKTAAAPAPTKITAPKNKYKTSDDVKLGREAAAQVRKELPIMKDERVQSYVSALGRKLEAAIPSEYSFPDFKYTFEPVNDPSINAFALPGGPMFLNRGLIEAAKAEGEVVGVMAHEVSHVLLRHGTANMTKASNPWLQLGQIGGIIGGAMVGGATGSLIQQGTQFGLGSVLMKYSRDFEKQADILGSHLMARAGYDPRDMANMFKTLEKEGGGGPEWMSDHPNPGNRAQYITREAQVLQVAEGTGDNSKEFEQIVAHLRDLPKPKKGGGREKTALPEGAPSGKVPAPAAEFKSYNGGNIFQIAVPSNWDELVDDGSITYSPPGGYGSVKGQDIFTHGVQIGLTDAQSTSLEEATTALVNALREGNPKMGRPSTYREANVGGRKGVQTMVENTSDATNQRETILLATAFLDKSTLIYAAFISPSSQYSSYQPVFQKIASSLKLR